MKDGILPLRDGWSLTGLISHALGTEILVVLSDSEHQGWTHHTGTTSRARSRVWQLLRTDRDGSLPGTSPDVDECAGG